MHTKYRPALNRTSAWHDICLGPTKLARQQPGLSGDNPQKYLLTPQTWLCQQISSFLPSFHNFRDPSREGRHLPCGESVWSVWCWNSLSFIPWLLCSILVTSQPGVNYHQTFHHFKRRQPSTLPSSQQVNTSHHQLILSLLSLHRRDIIGKFLISDKIFNLGMVTKFPEKKVLLYKENIFISF